ncbi:MAG TPA: SPW repeat protein [Bradyrhizobium sp.]|nr:SPW repeat protein [Bradyrhizobium sp.]
MKLRRIAALDCYTGAFGLFLFISPWLFAYVSEKARMDIWTSGAAIAAISIAAIVAFSDWEEWVNVLLGLWLIVSPWALGFAHTRAMHVTILIGVLVVFFAALELWLVHFEPNYPAKEPEKEALPPDHATPMHRH